MCVLTFVPAPARCFERAAADPSGRFTPTGRSFKAKAFNVSKYVAKESHANKSGCGNCCGWHPFSRSWCAAARRALQVGRHTSSQPRYLPQNFMKPLSSCADIADPAAVAQLHLVLRDGGAQALVRSLNARVPHRITGFYRLQREVLATLCLHDKRGVLQDAMLADVPLTDSFCQFAMRDGFFETLDSSE